MSDNDRVIIQKEITTEKLEEVDIWAILGNKNRRKVIELLSERPMTISQLYEHLDQRITKRAITKILTYLKGIGILVEVEIKQNTGRALTYYRIAQRIIGSFVIAPNYFKIETNNIKGEKKSSTQKYKHFSNINQVKGQIISNLAEIDQTEYQIGQLNKEKQSLLKKRQQLFRENQMLGSILTKGNKNIVSLSQITMLTSDQLMALMYEDVKTLIEIFRRF